MEFTDNSSPVMRSAVSQGKQPAPPEPDIGYHLPSSSDASTSQLSKRRRGIGVITPNACNECRKKRVKCDGGKPCGRCQSQRPVACVYELPVRQSKENLRQEIENLRRRQQCSDSVMSALLRPDLREEILNRLKNGEMVDDISDWLDGSQPPSRSQSVISTSFIAVASSTVAPPPLAAPLPPIAAGFVPFQSYTNPASSIHSPESVWTAGPFQAPSRAASTHSTSRQEWTPSIAPQSHLESWPDRNSPSASSEAPYRGLDQFVAPSASNKGPAGSWTMITNDAKLVQHLLSLYFCWEYPTFATLSKEHFLQDFNSGLPRYCSSILVNALLALGCRFSNQANNCTDPNSPYSSGDHFFRECQRLLNLEEDMHNFTTIQALGIMSIREASCGRDSESWFCAGQSIRLAIEMGLHQVQHGDADKEDTAVQAATFWGAFSLDHAWSLATGTIPQCSCFPTLPPKPAIISDIEASLWIPYTDDGAPLEQSYEQPSNVRSVYASFCELSELVHQSLYILHSPGRPLVSRDLLNVYTQYLNWYDLIPEALRLGRNFTPAVLFNHMYYHYAILLLFRPLIKFRIIGSRILPRDVCIQAADAIQALLHSYSQLYTLRRTPSFVPYIVLMSSIMHLDIKTSGVSLGLSMEDAEEDLTGDASLSIGTPSVGTSIPARQANITASSSMAGATNRNSETMDSSSYMDIRVADSINRGIADLTEMIPCHQFAEQALTILRFLARKWDITLNAMAVVKAPSGGVEDAHDEYATRPLMTSLNFFAPNMVESNLSSSWGGLGAGISNVASVGSTAPLASLTTPPSKDKLEDPLFFLSPIQGRPMLLSGSKLEEAGFVML